jgi:hypothetical protein
VEIQARGGPGLLFARAGFLRSAEPLCPLAWISTERNRPNIQIAKRFTRLKNPPVAVGQISVLIDPAVDGVTRRAPLNVKHSLSRDAILRFVRNVSTLENIPDKDIITGRAVYRVL